MDDALTQLVLDYQAGLISLDRVRNPILIEAFAHLNRYRRKGEDEVSEFLLLFHAKVEGLVLRFQCRGLPFRHFLLRSLRWQWNSFRSDRARERRRALLAVDQGLGAPEPYVVAEPPSEWEGAVTLSEASRRRLVLLVLKAVPYLEDSHLEVLSDQTGADLAWLQACQYRLRRTTAARRERRAVLVDKRSDVYYKRLVAEDEARREADPERRTAHEKRARTFRGRLVRLSRQQDVAAGSPTHLEVANLLGMPKGSVDSGLYHVKKELGDRALLPPLI